MDVPREADWLENAILEEKLHCCQIIFAVDAFRWTVHHVRMSRCFATNQDLFSHLPKPTLQRPTPQSERTKSLISWVMLEISSPFHIQLAVRRAVRDFPVRLVEVFSTVEFATVVQSEPGI